MFLDIFKKYTIFRPGSLGIVFSILLGVILNQFSKIKAICASTITFRTCNEPLVNKKAPHVLIG